jgi:hypothetical protein
MHKQTYGVWCDGGSSPKMSDHWLCSDDREEGMPKIESDGEEIFIRSTYEAAEEKAKWWRDLTHQSLYRAKKFAVCSCCEKEFDTDEGGNYQPDGLAQCVPCNHLVFQLMDWASDLLWQLCQDNVWCQCAGHDYDCGRVEP